MYSEIFWTLFLLVSLYHRQCIRNRSTPYLQCICTACSTDWCTGRRTISHRRASTRSLRFLLGRTVLRLPSSRNQSPIHRSIHILHLSDKKIAANEMWVARLKIPISNELFCHATLLESCGTENP